MERCQRGAGLGWVTSSSSTARTELSQARQFSLALAARFQKLLSACKLLSRALATRFRVNAVLNYTYTSKNPNL